MQNDNASAPTDRRDSAALFFDLLKKRDRLPAIVGMHDGFHGHALDRDEADPYSCTTSASRPFPAPSTKRPKPFVASRRA